MHLDKPSTTGSQYAVEEVLEHYGVNLPSHLLFNPNSRFLGAPSTDCHTTEEAWMCTAELNLILQANLHRFQSIRVKNQISYTRSEKMRVFKKLQFALPAKETSTLFYQKLLPYVLQEVYSEFKEVSVVKHVIMAPDWLHSWCGKWECSEAEEKPITIFAVHAYRLAPQQGCIFKYNIGVKPTLATSGPATTLYLPLLV